MENVEIFVNFCEAYGVPRASVFQTVDLFEGRNMAQVLSCIQQLGTEVSEASYLHRDETKPGVSELGVLEWSLAGAVAPIKNGNLATALKNFRNLTLKSVDSSVFRVS